MDKNYPDINAKAIDSWAEQGWEWSLPVSREEYARARDGGKWDVLLTPQIPVPHGWFEPYLTNDRLDGARILGLASGGGQQMPIFAALGAHGTVLDYSLRQLASERLVAEREGYAIHILRADMTRPLPLEDSSFDVIFHPVSNCYVQDVYHVWNECFRVLKPGGLLLAGMDNSLNYLVEGEGEHPLLIVNKLPYNPLADPELMKRSIDQDGSVQFSHGLEEQLGGQLKAGFVLTHLYEDRDREGLLRQYAPQYFATRAIKP